MNKQELNIIDFRMIGEVNYGSKFMNLAVLDEKGINVPDAICVSSKLLEREVENYLDNRVEFEHCFRDIETTSGCYLLETYSKIEEMISGFHFSEEGKNSILGYIRNKFDNYDKIEYAVRSSAAHEDGGVSSFAGIYETSLNVTFDDIIRSMEIAIVSYYSYQGIIARIRNGNYSYKIEMNLIIQKMVHSIISGVGFSKSTVSSREPLVEWLYGLGELLVSGEKKAEVYYRSKKESCENKELLEEVIVNIEKIKDILGYEVDVEWCFDGKEIYFVQARPITDTLIKGKNNEVIFDIDRLYFDTNIEYCNNLLQCENVYRSYTSKRSPKYILAQRNNIHTGKGYVLHFNLKGLKINKNKIEELCSGDYFEKFDIDVDDTIRQNIINKDNLWDYMNTIFGGYDENLEHTMIIREFISGEIGCISHLLDNGNVYIEYSSDGLLTMNRGLAKCESLVLKKDGEFKDGYDELWWNDIKKFTLALNNPALMIEWVICNAQAYFIDFSEELGDIAMNVEECSNKVIMPGNISGPVIYINNVDVMKKLSLSPGVSVHDTNEKLKHNPGLDEIVNKIKKLDEKPIVFADKPYAVLSLLFDDVKGFVFASGSLLCHLSILLREAKIPAVICNENFEKYIENFTEVIIVNGNIEPIIEKE